MNPIATAGRPTPSPGERLSWRAGRACLSQAFMLLSEGQMSDHKGAATRQAQKRLRALHTLHQKPENPAAL